MVYFTCNICGESLKKKQVDRHCVTKCRNAWFFTCMDCGKTFEGFEYEKHTTCMTETEKYQGFYLKNKGKVEENNGSEVKINTKRKKMEVGEEIKINGEEVSKEPKWEKYLKHGEWGGWKRTIKRLLKDNSKKMKRTRLWKKCLQIYKSTQDINDIKILEELFNQKTKTKKFLSTKKYVQLK